MLLKYYLLKKYIEDIDRLLIEQGRDLQMRKWEMWMRIYVPSARQSVSQGRNVHEGRLFIPRESFTFRDRREEGHVV